MNVLTQRRINQSQMERRYLDSPMMDKVLSASVGVHCPVPIAGMPAWARDGALVHLKNGGENAERLMKQMARPATLKDKLGRMPAVTPWEIEREKMAAAGVPEVHGMAGFSSLSDLIAECSAGKTLLYYFVKAVTTATTAGRTASAWNVGSVPAAGGAAAAFAAGATPTDASTGAYPFPNPTSGDTQHITTMVANSDRASQLLILYDRLYHGNHTMTADPQSVSGTLNRYTTAALAAGSFISGEVTTVLPASTPTVTFTYLDENAASSSTVAETIVSASAVATFPIGTVGQWFARLAAGDQGVTELDNIDLSAAMASGAVNWFVGHPLAFIPIPLANTPVVLDGINSAFNLQRIYDDACLSFLDNQFAVGTTNITLALQTVSG